MRKSVILAGVISVVLFTGCANSLINNDTSVINQEPKWLLDPYIEQDKYAAVGCSKIHFNGVTAQEKLAVSRAIDKIATQKRVTVDNVTLRRKSTSNGYAGNSSSDSSSLQSVEKLAVSTKTKAIYTKKNGEICVWVVSR